MSKRSDLEPALANMIFLGSRSQISVGEISLALRVSEKETAEAVYRLKKLGYPLQLSRTGLIHHRTFRPIDAERLRACLMTERIGRRIEWRLHVHSTQEELKSIADEVSDGTVLLAESQYGGRGRRGRSWFSPVGGIWLSVLLKPAWPESHQVLTLAFAAAAARAVSTVTKLSVGLKWPNDLMVRSRKVAGILAEAVYKGKNLTHMIAGLGVNANVDDASLPETIRSTSTSLNRECGRDVDRNLLTSKILEEMDSSYRAFESGRTNELLEDVRKSCCTLGRRVRATTVDGVLEGQALDLGKDGQLLVQSRDGTVVHLYSADLVHLR